MIAPSPALFKSTSARLCPLWIAILGLLAPLPAIAQGPAGNNFQLPGGQRASGPSTERYPPSTLPTTAGNPGQYPPAGNAAGNQLIPGSGGIPAVNTAASGNIITAAADGGENNGEANTGGNIFMSLFNRLMAGGPLMIPLALCSLMVIALAVERMVALRRGRVIPRPFVRRFTECVQDGQLSHEEALEICDEFDCPVAEVFHATVKRWGRPTVEIEQAVMDAGERVAEGLRKYLRLFSAVSNVAPLLGLLGTVIGMIEAFEALSSSNSDSPPDMLASGISQALITTAAGLSVAIPAYLAYVYFSARADRYLVEIDALCQRVVDSISAEGLNTGPTARGTNRRAKRAA
ncbi:MotA/TolQ/ExbB proton channel family protein [Planctomycetaceae bacterium SH139]